MKYTSLNTRIVTFTMSESQISFIYNSDNMRDFK